MKKMDQPRDSEDLRRLKEAKEVPTIGIDEKGRA